MQGLALAMKDAEPVLARARAERRRFRRVRVDLPGRLFTPSDGREARCSVVDLSPGGAAIRCEAVPELGTPVVLYVDSFGRFEGVVARKDGAGFGVAFHCTATKRERTAEQLTLFLNKSLVDESVLRRHERSSQKGFAKFTRADGQIVNCEVMDISVGGVSLKTEVKPPILADAIVEVTETGSSLRANNLRIVDEVLQSTTRFVANRAAYADPWKKKKIDNIALMLQSCLAAEGKVGLMMNVRRADLSRVLGQLPALQKPTVASLSDPDWVDVNTIVDESFVRVIVPQLKAAGARGIVEYQISKIID